MKGVAAKGWRLAAMGLAIAVAIAFVFLRFPSRDAAPAVDLPGAPPAVAATLRRACYDCHSDQTRWPWYGRVPPLSWLVARDVFAGRRQVNFSQWNNYYPATRRHKLQWMGRALRHDGMPPWLYRVIHPGARLSAADRALLEQWIALELAKQ